MNITPFLILSLAVDQQAGRLDQDEFLVLTKWLNNIVVHRLGTAVLVRLETTIECFVMVAVQARTLLGTVLLTLQCHQRQQRNLQLCMQPLRHGPYLGSWDLSRTLNLLPKTRSLNWLLPHQVWYLAQDILHQARALMEACTTRRVGTYRCLGRSTRSYSSLAFLKHYTIIYTI